MSEVHNSNVPWVSNYWGKAQPLKANSDGPGFHPLAWHMLDVAAATRALLNARPVLASNLARLLKLELNDAKRLLVWLAAIHDLGKFARPFQAKVLEHWHERNLGTLPSNVPYGTNHDGDGVAFFACVLEKAFEVDRVWTGLSPHALKTLANASFCHHGAPTVTDTISVGHLFGPGLDDAISCLVEITDLLLQTPIISEPLEEEEANEASYLIAGTVIAADWLGSSQTWFPYRRPNVDLQRYWNLAQSQGEKAVYEAGYYAAHPAPEQTFQTLTGKVAPPTPLQKWALDVEIPEWSTLFILEDVTGAGKTEAAHILVNRLMARNRASGAFWAMPTMATANAMYARQQDLIAGLFDAEGPRPSLALAHGQARLHNAFQNSKVLIGRDEAALTTNQADVTASAACNAFLADDRRLSLLADIGAGTIDQALLAVLPSRFNTVRLMGLCEKVLVIDEAHAYDAYVGAELKRLLEFHRAGGGSAIILSATLPNRQRADLVEVWQGLRGEKRINARLPDNEKRYPLATMTSDTKVLTQEIEPASWSRRRLPVRILSDADVVLTELSQTLRAGGCAAWVRNTVDDVLIAADIARNTGLKPLLFHARFAQCDRQRIEAEIMTLFGPTSTDHERAGKLVIATQVIEQSLDIDFDQLASDIAPIDLIVQRAGRMRRHNRADRAAMAGTDMLVLCPPLVTEPDANWVKSFLPGAAAVYADHGILWRTAKELTQRGALMVPDDLRALVEAVYSEDAPCPAALVASGDKAEGKGKGQAQMASNMLLKLSDGYKVGTKYQSELKIQTRDAMEQAVIRLAKRDNNGRIIPWAQGQSATVWQDWALSEVKAPLRMVSLDATSPPELEQELALIRAKWGRFEREIAVCVLEDGGDGVWSGALQGETGKSTAIRYSVEHGLLNCK